MPKVPYIFVMLLITSPIFFFVGMHPIIILAWVAITIPYIIFSLTIFVVEISSDGVSLYRKKMLRWEDVENARIRNLMGLRYLFVKRHKGMNYWIPLYFKGDTPIDIALREKAPIDNPIASCL